MENIDKNADVLTILDNLKDYAVEYEERKQKQEEEEKRQKEENSKQAERAKAEAERKQNVQAEIAEILGKIKEQEAKDAARWEEERRIKEEKKRKEEEMKAKIEEQLKQMQELEAIQQAKIEKDHQRRAEEKIATLLKEAEEQKKREKREAVMLEEKKRIKEENEMKKKVTEELGRLRRLEMEGLSRILDDNQKENPELEKLQREREKQMKKEELVALQDQRSEKRKIQEAAAALLRKEQGARKVKDEENRRLRIVEEEKQRQILVEEEKRRLLAEEQANLLLQVGEERKKRMEDDRRIAAGILARKQAEEDEFKRMKQEAEDLRIQAIEEANRKALEDKKKAFEKKHAEEVPLDALDRPKRKSVCNPFAKKFEEIAANALNEEKLKEEMMKKKRKAVKKSRDLIRRSKQVLNRSSRENMKQSQNCVKRKSNDSLKGESFLKKSLSNLRRSLSKECMNKSKSQLYEKDKNLSSKNLNHGKSVEGPPVSKQKMQNYLVSQVLFDGKEDVRTSRMHLQNKANAILEEAEDTRRQEENKRKELAMIERENQLRKQAEEELSRIRQAEEEQRIKKEEAQFESYKKEMEKYLDFVCDSEDTKTTKKKRDSLVKTVKEPSKKLKLNIGNIRNQFEEGNVSQTKEPTSAQSAPPMVKKLAPVKMFEEKKEEEKKPKSKKDYVPVIIDKAAFERTMGMFEKEKRAEEERQENELRLKKRRAAMEVEKQRLQQEKERQQAEVAERLRQWEEDEDRRKVLAEEEERSLKEEKEKYDSKPEPEPEPKQPDIFEQIKLTLAKIKEDEEVQRIKIEKERKKKELQNKIQEEISKIHSVDKSLKEADDDGIPAWIKMVTGTKKKTEEVIQKVETKEPKIIDRTIVQKAQTEANEDLFAPKWITMFQERNKKMQAQRVKTEEEENARKIRNAGIELFKQSLGEETSSRCQEPDLCSVALTKSQTVGSLDMKTFEQKQKKSVADVKHLFESNKKEEKVEIEKRTGKQKVADKVKRVKSMLMESGKSEQKVSDKKITKQKAQKMKSMFETKDTPDAEEMIEAPKRPKKKFIKPTTTESVEVKPTKKEEQTWKWKEKSVSELYGFINHNRQHLPETLAAKADKTFIQKPIEKTEQTEQIDEQDDDYISKIQNYIIQEDKDETESIFKDTIVAYLDLIDANPRKNNKVKKSTSKKMFSVNTAAMKDRLEISKDVESEKRDIVVGKVDTSFLFKEKDYNKQTSFISHENIKTIKSKYEELGVSQEPHELYSMARKLTVVAPAVVQSQPTKEEQVRYQWKYKQKGIEELNKFMLDNKKKVEKVSSQKASPAAYVPMFDFSEMKKRNENEDKKMEEFEKFMEEVHGYLESDTKDHEESAFKWAIHSYIDLIEEDQEARPITKYEKKSPGYLPENVPNMTEIKAKLQEQSLKTSGEKAEMAVGKVDLSFLETNESSGFAKKVNVEVTSDVASKMREQFEMQNGNIEQPERVVVKKKLIDFGISEEPQETKRPISNHEWKYKQKSLAELQEFISKNRDIAPKEIVADARKAAGVDASELLAKSNMLTSKIVDKEEEFEAFMDELDAFMGKGSLTKEEDDVKETIQGYLDLIDSSSTKNKSSLPSLGSMRKIKDIKSSLTKEGKEDTKEATKLIGKVSHFFKKSTNEKVDSSVIRENIATLLQPGKAKILGKAFEDKPKLTRANSAMDITRMPRKLSLDQFIKPKKEDHMPMPMPRKQPLKPKQFVVPQSSKPEPRTQVREEKKTEILDKYKNEWEDIEDPIEKQNAILAKYGLRPMKTKTDEEEEQELDDILNYECTDEVSKYEHDLRLKYGILDDESSEEENETTNKKGSFSSLLNILTVMKKATTSKNFVDAKSRAGQFGKDTGRLSHSEVDLTDIKGSCTDLRDRFESGRAFQTEEGRCRRQSLDIEEEGVKLDTATKKAQWEEHFMGGGKVREGKSRTDIGEAIKDSVKDVKDMFENGVLNQDTIKQYFNQRSETTKDKSVLYAKVKQAFEGGVVKSEKEEESITERERIQLELEELRESSKNNSRFRIERGSGQGSGGLRRANSCSGVTGERILSELDDDTMKEVSVTQKMVKAMFEQQTAPKVKFGGSGSNLSLNQSKEDVNKPVMRKVAKPKDERKWVLDSINKYFEVIVEEEEEKEEDFSDNEEDEYSDEDEEESEYEYSDEEEDDEEEETPATSAQPLQSSSKMRGLLSSVVTDLSGSVTNLGKQQILSSLKQGLGSRTNLRSSTSQLNLAKI